jgi:hypothetical protein
MLSIEIHNSFDLTKKSRLAGIFLYYWHNFIFSPYLCKERM